jgi:hypothetical protein
MTVAELIAKLQTMDQSLPVWVGSTMGPFGPGSLDSLDEVRETIVDGKYIREKEQYEQLRVVMIELE